jgi:hypothetical protein
MRRLPLIIAILVSVLSIQSVSATAPYSTIPDERLPYGAVPGNLMVTVRAQYGQDPDVQIWHEPLTAVRSKDEDHISIQLAGHADTPLTLPLSESTSPQSVAEIIEKSTGELLRVEIHPAIDVKPPGSVHVSWTLSPFPEIMGQGPVQLPPELYREILGIYRDDPLHSGMFAPITRARKTLADLIQNATDGPGDQAATLGEQFMNEVRESRVSLAYFQTPAGAPVTKEYVQELVNQGRIRVVQQDWDEALQQLRTNAPVIPKIEKVEIAWEKCPSDEPIQVEMPRDRKTVVLSEKILQDLREGAIQRWLDRAAEAAEAGNAHRTEESLEKFNAELELANEAGAGLLTENFEVNGQPATGDRIAYLRREARGETGFLGFFRALWRRVVS